MESSLYWQYHLGYYREQLMPEILEHFPNRRSLTYKNCHAAVVSEGVVERITDLTSLYFDESPAGVLGVPLRSLWQLQDLTMGLMNQQPIIISDAARLTSLHAIVGTTMVLTNSYT